MARAVLWTSTAINIIKFDNNMLKKCKTMTDRQRIDYVKGFSRSEGNYIIHHLNVQLYQSVAELQIHHSSLGILHDNTYILAMWFAMYYKQKHMAKI